MGGRLRQSRAAAAERGPAGPMARPWQKGGAMWYVVQVATGREQAACDLIGERVDASLLKECFVPRRTVAFKEADGWKTVEEPLFPGYVIVDTSQPKRLHGRLLALPDFARLLDVDGEFLPLDDEEVAWIDAFTRRGHRVVDMSHAVVEGGIVRIVDGPLVGREAQVKRINRRKRTAILELRILGRDVEVPMGLEVVRRQR